MKRRCSMIKEPKDLHNKNTNNSTMSTIILKDHSHPLAPFLASSTKNAGGWVGGRVSHCLTSNSGEGLYYYEAKILIKPNSGGVVRLGWSWDRLPSPDHEVGKDPFSFGYDGQKGTRIYKNKRIPYGEAYGDGDIIGCFIDMTSSLHVMFSFAKNGKIFDEQLITLSFPFSVHSDDDSSIDCRMLPFYPSFALKNAAVSMNFGTSTFVFPPDISSGYRAVSSATLLNFNRMRQLLQTRIPSSAEERLISLHNNNISQQFQTTTETSSKVQLQTAIHQKLFENGKKMDTILHQFIIRSCWDPCRNLIQMLMSVPVIVRRRFVSMKNRQGKTALHIALTNSHIDIKFAVLLVKAGYSLFVKDHNGMTPFDCIVHDHRKQDILFDCGGSRQAFAIVLAGYGFLTLRIKPHEQKQHPGTIKRDLHCNHFRNNSKRKRKSNVPPHCWGTLGSEYWAKANNDHWLKWSCCGGEANSIPCTDAILPDKVCPPSVIRVF